MEKLDCPFCGEYEPLAIEIHSDHEGVGCEEFYATCVRCDCRGPIGESEMDALKKWNERV